MEKIALVALGANLPSEKGEPRETLAAALDLLAAEGGRLTALSRWLSTPAHPAGSGPDYVNAAAAFEGFAAPEAALAALHGAEAALGRVRERRWGARSIDLDLIAFDDCVRPDRATAEAWAANPAAARGEATPDRLILPHPRLAERSFVLVPLAEIAPHWRHPLTGASVAEMLALRPEAERAAVVPLSSARP